MGNNFGFFISTNAFKYDKYVVLFHERDFFKIQSKGSSFILFFVLSWLREGICFIHK